MSLEMPNDFGNPLRDTVTCASEGDDIEELI
jgi:hypothetical protein